MIDVILARIRFVCQNYSRVDSFGVRYTSTAVLPPCGTLTFNLLSRSDFRTVNSMGPAGTATSTWPLFRGSRGSRPFQSLVEWDTLRKGGCPFVAASHELDDHPGDCAMLSFQFKKTGSTPWQKPLVLPWRKATFEAIWMPTNWHLKSMGRHGVSPLSSTHA